MDKDTETSIEEGSSHCRFLAQTWHNSHHRGRVMDEVDCGKAGRNESAVPIIYTKIHCSSIRP